MPDSRRADWLPFAAALATAALTLPAQAIIVSGGTGTAPLNNTAPGDDPGWNRVGSFETAGGNGSGVYLGNGWVLTANHVNGKGTLTLNGDAYTFVAGTGQRLANPVGPEYTHPSDLWIGQYAPAVGSDPLPAGVLTIATSTPAVGTTGTMIGTGQTQTSQTETTFYADTNVNPWNWDDTPFPAADTTADGFFRSGPRDKRWAQSPVSTGQTVEFIDFPNDSLDAVQPGFYTTFMDLLNSGLVANNDSGSGFFVKNGSTWELAGIAHALALYTGQGTDPDVADTAMYGNETFYSDLSVYAAQINAIVVPEPTTAGLMGVAAVALLRRRMR